MTHQYADNLKSERLVTRFLRKDDVKIWTEFFKDEDAVQHFPSFGITDYEKRAEDWIDKQIDRYMNKEYGLQALLDKETKKFIGQCGLIAREVDGVSEIEVGYSIFKNYWGQGFAPEASRLFIDYAFNKNLSTSIISIIAKRNINSQRVAEKNGLIQEKEIKWSGQDVYIYRIQRAEWQ